MAMYTLTTLLEDSGNSARINEAESSNTYTINADTLAWIGRMAVEVCVRPQIKQCLCSLIFSFTLPRNRNFSSTMISSITRRRLQ